jgi:xylan 1,4-beta-xylosidase
MLKLINRRTLSSGVFAGFGMLSLLGKIASASVGSLDLSARQINFDLNQPKIPLDRAYNFSIGSDYPGTLIREENLAQLNIAKTELGFRYIRFHDIFTDALGTVSKDGNGLKYNWSRIDYLFDRLLGMNIKPFVELGFSPNAIKTSEQTIFYWKGNTSHPIFDKWAELVAAFVNHIVARYGSAEVRTWFFEFWNEPNLDGFWQYADKEAYFALYGLTANTIKKIDAHLKVGGPSTAGAAWVTEFLEYCKRTNSPVDFVTTHTYGVQGGFLDENGQQDTKLDPSPDAILADVRRVRNEITASTFPDLPLYFTEWSTSYTPRDLVHDSYISAAYIVSKLSQTKGIAQGMSYWVHTDLFEEPGPPTTPFHGGFGLMTKDGIKKSSWFVYKYLNALKGYEIISKDKQTWAAYDGAVNGNNAFNAVIWDFVQPQQNLSNRSFFSRLVPSFKTKDVMISIQGLPAGDYILEIYRTGYKKNDPYSAYIEMGSPEILSQKQLKRLNELSKDEPEIKTIKKVSQNGLLKAILPMNSNDVVLISAKRM